MTECDEVADNFPLPPCRLTFDEALAIVRAQMPDESETILSNIAERGTAAAPSTPAHEGR